MAAPGSTLIALRSTAAADSISPRLISATARCSTASGDSAALLCRPLASPPQPRAADIATDPAAIVRLTPTAMRGSTVSAPAPGMIGCISARVLGLGLHESIWTGRPNVGLVLNRARAAGTGAFGTLGINFRERRPKWRALSARESSSSSVRRRRGRSCDSSAAAAPIRRPGYSSMPSAPPSRARTRVPQCSSTSSCGAQISSRPFENRSVILQDPSRHGRIRVEPPFIPVVSPSEHDPVASREHVVVALDHNVIDLGLREQNR